jgi:uncharacterized repeat protein (TIGR01451 family)
MRTRTRTGKALGLLGAVVVGLGLVLVMALSFSCRPAAEPQPGTPDLPPPELPADSPGQTPADDTVAAPQAIADDAVALAAAPASPPAIGRPPDLTRPGESVPAYLTSAGDSFNPPAGGASSWPASGAPATALYGGSPAGDALAGELGGSSSASARVPVRAVSGADLPAAAQSVSGLVVDLGYDAVWGTVSAGDTVTVERTAGGAAFGAAEANGVGFFWTSIWNWNGEPVDLVGWDTLVVYVNGTLEASVTPGAISGALDVLNDTVDGTIDGASAGTPVTVTLGVWANVLAHTPQVTTSTDAGGNFTADFGAAGYDLGPHNFARVEYPDGSVTVQGYAYPEAVFHVDTLLGVSGYAQPGQPVTATLVRGGTPVDSVTTWANWPHGSYWADLEIQPDDVVEVDLGGGTVISTTAYELLAYPDPALDRVTGTCPPNETVRVFVSHWALGTYAEVTTVADASGNYTATFNGFDLQASASVYPAFADDEGDEVLLSTTSAKVVALPWGGSLGGSGDAPNVPYTITLYHAPDTFTQTGTTALGFNDIGAVNFGVEIAPGDVVTLETPTWSGSMTVPDLQFSVDTANDRVTGDSDIAGWAALRARQWNWYQYPVNGQTGASATVSSPFTITLADFDLRDGCSAQLLHYDADDNLTFIGFDLRAFEVSPPWGVGAPQWGPFDVMTATLYESDGATVKFQTSQDSDDNWDWYWMDLDGRVEPGDWITVTDRWGWSAGLHVPALTLEVDAGADMVWGQAPKALVYVEGGRDESGFDLFVPSDDYALHTAYFGHDLQWGDGVSTIYQAPNGNRVRRDFRFPQIAPFYDMEGHSSVMGGGGIPGNTIYVTVTHPVHGVIFAGTTAVGTGMPWFGPNNYRLDMPDGTVVPGNVVTVDFGDGFVDSVEVVALSGYPDVDTDIVTGTVPAEGWFDLSVGDVWGNWNGVENIQADASGVYTVNLSAEVGWDILPGDYFGLWFPVERGHVVIYDFWLPVPELGVWKWNVPGHARPGGTVMYGMYYRNDGNGTAEDVVIVDTLPPSTTWAADTSGVTPVQDSGVITWELGPVEAGGEREFYVALVVDAAVPTQTNLAQNCVAIDTSTPGDYLPDNDESCAGEVWVDEGEYGVGVDKWPEPGDPHPGEEFAYYINLWSDGGAASGPVWLTDTLPVSTTFERWDEEWGNEAMWTEVVTTGGQFVLHAPAGLPGDWGGRIRLVLEVDPGAPIGTRLGNYVEVYTPGDMNPDNNADYDNEATVSDARTDLALDKNVHNSVPVPGGWMNYFISYNNDGNVATHVWVTDTIPAGLSFVEASWGGGDQPNADEYLPEPTVIGDQLVWDLGVLPVGESRWFHIQMNISGALEPDDVITNCAVIGSAAPDDTPENNEACVVSRLYPAESPNLWVTKQHQHYEPGNEQIDYEIYFGNRSLQTIWHVRLTDTLPVSTVYQWDDVQVWWGPEIPITITNNYTDGEWLLELERLEPGQMGQIQLNARFEDPNTPLRWYTNTVEIDTPPDDAEPADNAVTDIVFSGGEVRWVDLNVYERDLSGCASAVPVTVTTVHEMWIIPFECWNIGLDYPSLPGDVLTVTAGSGQLPVRITIPDPFDVYASSITDTVWGQIDFLPHDWLEVDLYDGPTREVQTDGSGTFEALFTDIPRAGRGEVRYRTEIDYAEVIFLRHFQTSDLIITVDYQDDWVNGNYEPGHTVWLTLTESVSSVVKSTWQGATGPVPGWDGGTGFEADGEDWVPQYPDIRPGDWVFGLLNSATYTTAVHVGTINGEVNVDADVVSGTLDIPWIDEPLLVRCEIHEENGESIEVYDVDPHGGDTFRCDFGALYDIVPGTNVALNYTEPDGDVVQTHPYNPAPRLQVHKWAQGVPGVGGNFSFHIQYWNNGGLDAEDVVITDTMLGMTYIVDTSPFSVMTGSLAGGEYAVFYAGTVPANSYGEFEVFVQINEVASHTITNTVEIATSSPFDRGEPEEKFWEWNSHVENNGTDLSVGKDAWTHDPLPDSDFVYSVNVCNGGEGNTNSAEIWLTDTLPVSTTFSGEWWADDSGWMEREQGDHLLVLSRPTFDAHRCSQVYLRVHLTDTASAGDELCNTAQVYAGNDTGDPGDNEQTWCHNVGEPHTNVGIDKWWAWGQLVPGGEIHYNGQYYNSGNVPVSGVRITETLPASTTLLEWRHYDYNWNYIGPVTPTFFPPNHYVWDVGAIPNGVSGRYEVVLQIGDAIPGTVLTNTVEISPQPSEDDTGDNVSTVVEMVHEHGPNLRVRKWGWWHDLGPGTRQIEYSVNFENIGDEPANWVTLTDTYPSEMTMNSGVGLDVGDRWWNSGDDPDSHVFTVAVEFLNPGDIMGFNFTVFTDTSPIPSGLILINTVEVGPPDAYPDDNAYEAVMTTGPNLWVAKDLVGGDLLPGEVITYWLGFGNDLPEWQWWWGMQGTARLTDTLPAGMEFITATMHWCGPEGEWCAMEPAIDGDQYSWGLWPIGAGQWNEMLVTARIPLSATGLDSFGNIVQIGSSEPISDAEAYTDDNSAEHVLDIALPYFEVGKVYESSRVAGTLVTYTLAVTNSGHAGDGGVVLQETLPAGLTYSASDGSPAGAPVSGVTWNLALGPGVDTAEGWFSAILPCSLGTVTNDAYQVVDSLTGVTSAPGPPVPLTVIAPSFAGGFDQSAAAIKVNGSVAFTSTRTSDGTAIVDGTWDLGDGHTASGLSTSHAYTQSGSYTVTLTVTDTCGLSSTLVFPNAVLVSDYVVYLPLTLRNYQ